MRGNISAPRLSSLHESCLSSYPLSALMGHCWGTPWSPLRIFSFPSLGFFQILPGRMRVCCCWTRRKSRGWRRALCSLHDAVMPVGLVLLLLCHATPGSPWQTWSGPPAIHHLVISKVRTSSKKENPFHLPLFSTIVFSKDWGQEEKGGDRVWDGWMASSTQWIWVWANSKR